MLFVFSIILRIVILSAYKLGRMYERHTHCRQQDNSEHLISRHVLNYQLPLPGIAICANTVSAWCASSNQCLFASS